MRAKALASMLWLDCENDEDWVPDVPKRWHAAWLAGGGQAGFHQLDAVRKTGHGGVDFDAAHWRPFVDGFLTRLGFAAPRQ